jgi:hypothetical protein
MNVTLEEFDLFEQKYVERSKALKEDPLVLSCVIKRLSAENEGVYYSLEDERLLDDIKEEDREQAELVRKYFTKKFFWQNFTDHRSLSSFRSRVCYLLESRIQECKDQDLGIYFKLPWFYDEDMIYEDFKKSYETVEVPNIVYGVPYGSKRVREIMNLQYLKHTFCYQRKRKIRRLWFTDQKYLFSIEVEDANPLLETFIDSLTASGNVKLEAFRNVDRIDKMWFYKIFNFKLLKEENA